MNAVRARCASAAPRAPPTCAATPSAPPTRAEDGGQHRRREVVRSKRGGEVVLVAGGQQAADDGHAQCSPTCSSAPLVAEPTPVCSRGSEPITDAVAHGMTRPAPTPSRIMPGHGAGIGGAEGGRRELPQPGGDDQQASGGDQLGPGRPDQRRGQRGHQRDRPGRRQDAHPRLQGGITQVELQELGQHEQRAEQPEGDQAHGSDGGGELPAPEEVQVQHRVRAGSLPGCEPSQDGEPAQPGPDNQA